MRFAPDYVSCVLRENFEDAKALLSPRHFVEVRTTPGGPALLRTRSDAL